MTKEEIARFALVLREAERVRARIAKDKAAARAHARAHSGGDVLRVAGLPTAEQPSGPAVVAAA
jgi:hypothetical protein